ncbi:MAG: 30S ribosomal protein S20 [Candidatus Pacebacteria bacterium]|nr:30S ribosomal protein S20 [Candidatus Paceibacterota bacterium]
MPNTISAKKALRQNERRRKINIRTKNKMKKDLKSFNELIKSLEKQADKITDSNIEEIQKILQQAYKNIDKTAKKGLIKKNNASRKKSGLAKKVNSLQKKTASKKKK